MNNEDSVKKRLLSPTSTEKVHITNEMNDKDNKSAKEADLRLHDAVYTVEIDEIKELLEENPNLVFECDDQLRTPLHTLAIAGDEEDVQIALLLLGVTDDGNVERPEILSITDSKGFTALHYSCQNYLVELTEVLLQYGAKATTPDIKGNTPLHLACLGGNERALKCAKLLLSTNFDGSLINTKNGMELTALHYSIKDQAVAMVELLLKKEYKLNIPGTVTSTGQTVFHFLCIETGETNKSCEIFKLLLNNAKQQINFEDENSRTCLHVAAIKRLPRIIEMLNSEDKLDVMKVDKRKRSGLHYSAENGAYPNGHRCVEILLSRFFKDSNKQIQYLYLMKDDMENTSFMYACLNCPVETMIVYLSTIPQPQFWMTETAMSLVYKQCPIAITGLFDRAFTEKEQSKDCTEKEVIFTDFGPITGYTDPVEKLPQQETKYLIEAQWWDFETQKEILTHPLVQLFVSKKCEKLKKIIYGWIAWQVVWLVAYTLLIFSVYRKDIDSQFVVIVSTLIVAFYLTLSLLNEIFGAFSVGISYLISWTNLTELCQICLGAIAILPVLLGHDSPTTWNRNSASLGILLAYILSMRDIGRLHEEIGLIVEVLKQVLFQIVKVLLCCLPLILGFTISFIILFEDEDGFNNATFPGPLVKVLVMMTGEFEYNDTFKTEGAETESKNLGFRLILFLSFLICVPVTFFNLLTGFALDRVMELRERAKVGRIAKQLEHIYFIESILKSLSHSPIRKLFPQQSYVDWLRKHNVTTVLMGGELQFATYLKEETLKKVDRRTMKDRQLDYILRNFRIFSSELPSEVRRQMFELASTSNYNKK